MKLKSLEQTCFACPSQWEGELEDGNFIYIRYRWGWLTYGIGKNINEAVGESRANEGISVGDDLDGSMDTNKMLEILGINQ